MCKERMTKRMFDLKFDLKFFWGHCFNMYFWFDVNLHHRIRYSFVLCILHSDFHWLLFFFHIFFLHLSSPLICLSRAKYGISLLTLCFANHNNEKKTNWTEREGWFFWCERVWERNNEFLFAVWMRHFKTQHERVFDIHADILCRHLQVLQDQKARRKLLTWLTISRFKFVGLI